MKNLMKTFFKKVRGRILYTIDHFYDMRICGKDLSVYIPSLYRDDKNGVGMTGSQSTHYPVLKTIFSHVNITDEDVFLDVGCSVGRVLAYCVKERFPCSINGIEINEVPGKIAESWTQKYDNVHVMIGDAFDINYDQYTILFLGRPFLPKTFAEFIDILEKQLTHPITFIYWVDQQSGHYLKGRKGGEMKIREKIEKIHGIKTPGVPQWYSIWEYKQNT